MTMWWPHRSERRCRIKTLAEQETSIFRLLIPGSWAQRLRNARIRQCNRCVTHFQNCHSVSTSRIGHGETPQPRLSNLCAVFSLLSRRYVCTLLYSAAWRPKYLNILLQLDCNNVVYKRPSPLGNATSTYPSQPQWHRNFHLPRLRAWQLPSPSSAEGISGMQRNYPWPR